MTWVEQLKKNKVLFLYGKEKYIQRKILSYFEREYLNLQFQDFNLHKFNGANTTTIDIIEACETLPLGDDKKVIIVKEVMAFIENNEVKKEFQQFLNSLPKGITLIFTEEQIPINGRLSFIKYLKKQKGSLELKTLNHLELKNLLQEELKRENSFMDLSTLGFFIEKSKYLHRGSESNLDEVINELHKIIDYAGSNPITKEMIQINYTDVFEENIFDFIDAFTRKDTKNALLFYERLMDSTHLFQVLAMIYRQIRLLIHTKLLLNQGFHTMEIQKQLGLPPFLVKKLIGEQKSFSMEFLREFYDYLATVDIGLKTGQISEYMIMEQIIFRFTKTKVKRKS
ncbi:MAG: DNA polymerase III subunit delta [Tissierellia bacterium]|nr:DNA polymerase III subunit delta [Tissierellia bacterium]